MSVDNASKNKFQSWNTEGANKDTRHWTPEASWDSEFNDLNDAFIQHQTLTHIQTMLDSTDPKVRELARSIISEKAGAAAALKAHNDKRAEGLRNQVARPADKHRRGWDTLEINRSVRNLLNSGGK